MSPKLLRYAGALLKALARQRPRDALRACAASPLMVKHLGEYGIDMVLDVRDKAISRPLAVIGEYEKNVAAVLARHFREDTCFLDLGANIGFFSLLAAAHCPRGQVLSFEPDPANIRLFRASIALNGFESRITLYPHAVSDRDEMLSFSNLGNAANIGARFTAKSRAALEGHAAPGAAFTEVRAVCLDTFLSGRKIDLVKVDIEGFEPYAFRGMAGLLRRDRPVVVTEFAPGTIRHISQTNPADLLALFRELGYEVGVIGPGGAVAPAAGDLSELGDRHHVDLLLTPGGQGR